MQQSVQETVDTVEAKVSELTAALKPRLRGVLHEAAFADHMTCTFGGR